MNNVAFIDPDLGRIFVPDILTRKISLPNSATRKLYRPGEVGIFVAKQHRPKYDDWGNLTGMALEWMSVTHNERVDAGASYQSQQVHGGGATPAAPSATAYFNIIAVASAVLTKTKTDQSLGSASAGVTTNEFTTIGLSRAAAALTGGNYTAPSTLGGQFAQVLSKVFNITGTGTAQGAGIFNSATAAGSILYVEDNFSSAASVVNGDTLTVTITVQN